MVQHLRVLQAVIRRLSAALVLALVLWAQPAAAAIVRVQEKAIPRNAGGTSSVALTSPTTAGNTILVLFQNFYSQSNYAGTPTATDGTNTYQTAISRDNGGGAYSPSLYIFYAMNIAGGSITVTITDHIGGDVIGYVLEYSGLAIASVVDQTASNQNASSTSFSSSSVTTTVAAELLIGWHGATGAAPATATGPFALVVDQNPSASIHVWAQEAIVSSTGSYQSAGTIGPAAVIDNVIATFKGTGGGGGSPVPKCSGGLLLRGVGCQAQP